MPRNIVSAAVARPSWEHNGFRLPGPDEDPFTLGIAALELLRPEIRSRGPQALRRVHAVGDFPSEVDWGFGEALGVPELEVRRPLADHAVYWVGPTIGALLAGIVYHYLILPTRKNQS